MHPDVSASAAFAARHRPVWTAACVERPTMQTTQEIQMKSNRIVFAALLAAAPFLAHADGGKNEFHLGADAFKSTRTVAEVRAEARSVMHFGEAGQPLEQWASPSTRTRAEVKRELALMPPVFQGA
jgi:hypothetical protein